MADILDLIKYANEGRPVDFSDAYSEIIAQKTINAIDQAKQYVAMNMFNEPESHADLPEAEPQTEIETDNGESYENSQTD